MLHPTCSSVSTLEMRFPLSVHGPAAHTLAPACPDLHHSLPSLPRRSFGRVSNAAALRDSALPEQASPRRHGLRLREYGRSSRAAKQRRLRVNPGEDHPPASQCSFYDCRGSVGILTDHRAPAHQLRAILPVLIEGCAPALAIATAAFRIPRSSADRNGTSHRRSDSIRYMENPRQRKHPHRFRGNSTRSLPRGER